MKDQAVDLCGAEGAAPPAAFLEKGEAFAFRCAGCGDCCRHREDVVLSGYDL